MRSPIMLAAAIAALLAVAAPASADRGSWNGWHVHDGTAVPYMDTGGLTHRGVAIFPAIFTGGNAAAYIADSSLWAYCPDATDKALLGDAVIDGSKSAAGVCMNENGVIHLLSVPEGQSPPNGWERIPGTATGYYKLTASG
jgi:hypothetical protein